jgi:LysR family transcriptional regulator, transcriptional activator of nhaA
MERLNYHHLRYFWVVAKEGSIARASEQLHLAHPTISAQIHRLEDALGEKLFARRGRQIVLTEFGRLALRYAEEIFSLGREFVDTANGRRGQRPARLVVGVLDSLAKSIVYRVLEPAFRLDSRPRVIIREGRSAEAFMGDLATQAVDLVLADAPAGHGAPVRMFSHSLGECGTAFFAAPPVARKWARHFPHSLDDAPFLMPSTNAAFRRALEDWFASHQVRPRTVADLEDLALAQVVGEAGLGIFAEPDVVEAEIRRRYNVRLVGRAKDLRQRFFAISLERKIKHPAVLAICAGARKDVFA